MKGENLEVTVDPPQPGSAEFEEFVEQAAEAVYQEVLRRLEEKQSSVTSS
ncbi:hypothetical protein ACVSNG_21435 [Pseudomonas aeruginosa]|nr:hypothetical protein [Pseudomonas aeruginosa]EKT8301417.1 hypothetical protein [Pseudomonas aeruginosa]EKV6889006.1 hypothetical protein [Pseudomonas aeruginosa]EKW4795633.1 hypothetical protein [Pseudomonas aeruginosa]EKW5289046.1 hypothetical protein [Pseudomonas aeruginosa]EKW5495617.1 hypothetical protein [Pseudomonas aeruginosa]